MKKIQRLWTTAIRARWKTITVLGLVGLATFTMGTFANQLIVQQIQSLAGNHVLVPAPELQIVSTTWNINGTASLIFGVTLNVTTVGGPAGVTKLYQVFIQVSCLNLPVTATSTEFTCATGSATITLPANGGSGRLFVPITPPIDPELIEVHDLSFIVTGTPGSISPPPSCTPTFNVTATPSVFTVNRTLAPVSLTVNKTITYFGNCPTATITLSTIVKPPSTFVTATVTPPAVTVPPGTAHVIEKILIQPGVAPGTYQVVETDTSGPVVVTNIVTVNVV